MCELMSTATFPPDLHLILELIKLANLFYGIDYLNDGITMPEQRVNWIAEQWLVYADAD